MVLGATDRKGTWGGRTPPIGGRSAQTPKQRLHLKHYASLGARLPCQTGRCLQDIELIAAAEGAIAHERKVAENIVFDAGDAVSPPKPVLPSLGLFASCPGRYLYETQPVGGADQRPSRTQYRTMRGRPRARYIFSIALPALLLGRLQASYLSQLHDSAALLARLRPRRSFSATTASPLSNTMMAALSMASDGAVEQPRGDGVVIDAMNRGTTLKKAPVWQVRLTGSR